MPEHGSIIHINLADLAIRRAVREEFSRYAERHRLPWTLALVDGDPHDAQWLVPPDVLVLDRTTELPRSCPARQVLRLDCRARPGEASLWFDDAAIGREAARHLIEQGWRRAVVLTKAPVPLVRERREAAFCAEFLRKGGEVQRFLPEESGHPASGVAWMRGILASARQPTAFFAFQDRQAAWLMCRLGNLGLSMTVPVGVVSCEDTPVAAECDPPVSSVRASWRLLARNAASSVHAFLVSGSWPELRPVPPVGVATRASTRLHTSGDVLVDKALKLIRHRLPRAIAVATLARSLGCSPITLLRHCMRTLGCSPQTFIQRLRLAEIETRLLDEPDTSIGDLAVRCGWCSASHLARDFRRHRGITPQRLRDLDLPVGRSRRDRVDAVAGQLIPVEVRAAPGESRWSRR